MTNLTENNEEINRLIVQARLGLLRDPKVAWLMSIILGHKYQITDTLPDGSANHTLAVDAKNFYVNPSFFVNLSPDTRKSAILHESLHIALKHIIRYVEYADPIKFNKACDYKVNYFLYLLGFSIPKSWLFDINLSKLDLRTIYDSIPDDPEQPQLLQDELGSCMFTTISTDDHPELLTAIHAAQNMVAGNPSLQHALGSVFGEFVAANITPLPFRTILSEYLNEISHDLRSWTRLNRRMFAAGHMWKGYEIGSMRTAVAAFDASGSMGVEQVNAAIEQIEYMRDVLQIQELHLIVFDSAIRFTSVIQQGTPIDPTNMYGNNGTNVELVMDYVEDNNISPEVLMVFTDMEVYLPPKPVYPVIWVGIKPNRNWVDNFLQSPQFYGRYAELK